MTGRLWQAQLDLTLDKPATADLFEKLVDDLDTFSPAVGHHPTRSGEILLTMVVVDAPSVMTALSMAYAAAGSVLSQHDYRIVACSAVSVRDWAQAEEDTPMPSELPGQDEMRWTPQDRQQYTFGGYVDLEEEDIRLPDGARLTDERAEQIAQETLAESRAARLSLLSPAQQAVIGELSSLRDTVLITTFATVDQTLSWLLGEIDRRTSLAGRNPR